MVAMTVLHNGPVAAIDYRCYAAPGDRPFAEQHPGFSVSYVRSESFGYRTRGKAYEQVAGGLSEISCARGRLHTLRLRPW